MGTTLMVDLVTCDPNSGEFVLYLVEDGPWAEDDQGWKECLLRIQNRVFDAVDCAVDGHLATRYPDSRGKKIRVQIDSPSGVPPELVSLISKMKDHLAADAGYRSAIANSEYVRGVRVVTGHEMGRFKSPGKDSG